MLAIDHLNRHVSSIDTFITFYTDALGYRLLTRGVKANGKPYAILQGFGHELFISEKDGFKPETEKNLRHIGYAVESADGLLKELKQKGHADDSTEIIVKRFSRQFYIKDPDGFEIDLIEWTDKQGFTESMGQQGG